jgi:hypothetical protein
MTAMDDSGDVVIADAVDRDVVDYLDYVCDGKCPRLQFHVPLLASEQYFSSS